MTGAALVLLLACSEGEKQPADALPPPLDAQIVAESPSDASVDGGAAGDSQADSAIDATAARDAATLDAAAADVGEAGLRMGFPPVSDITKNGAFATNNPQGENEGPSCTVHRPAMLGQGGVRHPLIVWGMGTGGFNTYQASFDLWASHGFVVVAALQGNGQGDGKTMLACLDYACTKYAANVDCRAGATGHSQGGGGAIMTGSDGRVLTTAPIMPYTQQGFGGFDRASIAKQQGPMLLLSGTADNIATPSENQQPVFEMINTPVVWANLMGGDHVQTGIDGAADYRSVVLAWFRLQLMDDQAFRPMFYGAECTLCKDPKWIVQQKGVP